VVGSSGGGWFRLTVVDGTIFTNTMLATGNKLSDGGYITVVVSSSGPVCL